MPDYTENQKKIALLLVHGPKTAEVLGRQLGIAQETLAGELKAMLKLGVVEKAEGYPPNYKLKENIAESVRKRKEIAEADPFKLRLRAVIEAQGVEQGILEKTLSDLEKALRKEKDFTIYDAVLEKTIQEGDNYSSFLEVNLSVGSFKALVKFMYFYGPSSVEVLKPEKLEVALGDLQDGLGDIAEMIQSYNRYITKLMSRAELAEFNRKLYEKRFSE